MFAWPPFGALPVCRDPAEVARGEGGACGGLDGAVTVNRGEQGAVLPAVRDRVAAVVNVELLQAWPVVEGEAGVGESA